MHLLHGRNYCEADWARLYIPWLPEVSQTSLFKFVNIFQVSEHAVAVLTPFDSMGIEQGLAPVRMLDPNPMLDITTPTAPFQNVPPVFSRTVSFPIGGYVADFTQVPIPAADQYSRPVAPGSRTGLRQMVYMSACRCGSHHLLQTRRIP